jgi:phage/plasmid primase-like uncharacterized protein
MLCATPIAPVTHKTNGHASPEAQILQQMEEAGIEEMPDDIIADGEIHRFGPKGACWYVMRHDPVLTYWYFGDWRQPDLKGSGETQGCAELTDNERTAIEQRRKESQVKIRADKERREKAAAAEAWKRWDKCPPAPETHGYLVKKKIRPNGAKIDGNSLLIPMRDIGGNLWSLQEISPTGWKPYMPGGRAKGCFTAIGALHDEDESPTILIGEGWSTCATLHEATDHITIAAGNAGNLELVARLFRDQYPESRIIVCGDDDWLTRPHNTAKLAAEKAAAAVNGEARLPKFDQARPHGATDFNDMASLYGLPAVRECILGDSDAKAGNEASHINAAKPKITVKPGLIHETATEAESILIKAGTPFYVRAGMIMIPVLDDETAAHGQVTKVARLRPVATDSMIDHLSRAALFQRWDGRSKKLTAVNPPHEVAQTILSRDGEWRFPKILGVITTPTLRPDGTVFDIPGYDPVTRLLLLAPPEMPAIPENPTKANAEAALALLNGLIDEFPFVGEESRSVALSALITPVVRGAMTVAPMHVFSAPALGTGKSYLVSVASAIATGQHCPVTSAGQSEEEMEKRLSGMAVAGQAIICIDNCNGEIGGDILAQLVERPVVTLRLLGGNSGKYLPRIENRATVFANGNNITPRADSVRRTIMCSLDANMKRPETRKFGHDPFAEVIANRGQYIAAALTIPRAHAAAGHPCKPSPYGSFEEWSATVRASLMWLGCADPLATQEEVQDEDPEKIIVGAIVEVLSEMGGSMTTGELILAADEKQPHPSVEYKYPELRQALIDAAGFKGEIDSRRLGSFLKGKKGKVVNELKLHHGRDSHTKQNKWSARRV